MVIFFLERSLIILTITSDKRRVNSAIRLGILFQTATCLFSYKIELFSLHCAFLPDYSDTIIWFHLRIIILVNPVNIKNAPLFNPNGIVRFN
jgi:hypothetical protein